MDTQEVDEENKLAKGEWIFYSWLLLPAFSYWNWKPYVACIALQLLQQMAKLTAEFTACENNWSGRPSFDFFFFAFDFLSPVHALSTRGIYIRRL